MPAAMNARIGATEEEVSDPLYLVESTTQVKPAPPAQEKK
jgi:hypothetical protein